MAIIRKGHKVSLSIGGGGFVLDADETSKQYTIRDKSGKVLKGVPKQLIVEVAEEVAKASEFLRVGDVLMCKQGLGIVRFIGEVVEEKNDGEERIGLELKDSRKAPLKEGLTDGTYNNKRYFKSPPNTAVFIKLNDIDRVLSCEDLLLKLAQLNSMKLGLQNEYRELLAKVQPKKE